MKAAHELMLRFLIVIIASCANQVWSQDHFPVQSWKNKEGKIVEASLYSIPSADKVVIRLKDSLRKYTLKKADLSPETVDQLDDIIDEVSGKWSNEDIIPTAELAYKAAALGLPQRKKKKLGEFQYLKVVSFNIKEGGREASALLEGNLAVEYLPTGDVRLAQSGNNLIVKNGKTASEPLILATRGAIFPMVLSGPMRWATVGVTECVTFTKIISVDGSSIYVDGVPLR